VFKVPSTAASAKSKPIPSPFLPLITLLRNSALRRPGTAKVLTGTLGERLGPYTYSQAGATRLKDYIKKAEQLGLVKMGGVPGGTEWVELAV